MNYNEKDHPRDKQGRWIEQGKALVNIIQDFRAGKEFPKLITISEVDSREKNDIEKVTGETIQNATAHTLHIDELRHIENRHGEKGIADSSMKDIQSYKHIPDILHNYDKVELLKDNKGSLVYSKKYFDKSGKKAKMIKYSKKINDDFCFVIEAVKDAKRNDLSIISVYKQKRQPLV